MKHKSSSTVAEIVNIVKPLPCSLLYVPLAQNVKTVCKLGVKQGSIKGAQWCNVQIVAFFCSGKVDGWSYTSVMLHKCIRYGSRQTKCTSCYTLLLTCVFGRLLPANWSWRTRWFILQMHNVLQCKRWDFSCAATIYEAQNKHQSLRKNIEELSNAHELLPKQTYVGKKCFWGILDRLLPSTARLIVTSVKHNPPFASWTLQVLL